MAVTANDRAVRLRLKSNAGNGSRGATPAREGWRRLWYKRFSGKSDG